MKTPGMRALIVAAFLALAAAACSDGPREVVVGAEECAHCRMLVSEERFASQLLTDRGRHYVFDSIECMAEFVGSEEGVPLERIRSLWVTDFTTPGRWMAVDDAHFLRSEELRSPMGLNLSAHADLESAREHRETFGGEILDWSEVLALVATTQVGGGGHGHVHAH